MSIESTENQLIRIAQQIGQIAESNCHYTAGLAKRIDATGKALETLTLAEFMALDDSYTHCFNSIHGGNK